MMSLKVLTKMAVRVCVCLMPCCPCVVGGETLYFTNVKFFFFFPAPNASVTFVCVGADNRIKSCDRNTAGIYEVNEGQRRRERRCAPLMCVRVCVCTRMAQCAYRPD